MERGALGMAVAKGIGSLNLGFFVGKKTERSGHKTEATSRRSGSTSRRSRVFISQRHDIQIPRHDVPESGAN